jgi:uroporphyrinogen-III synthase
MHLIMLTRPHGQSDELANKLEAAGIKTVIFPTIAIIDPPTTDSLKKLPAHLSSVDIIIFISPAAVHKMKNYCDAMPKNCQLLTIGKDTARLVRNSGWGDAIYPEENFNRDALLALPLLQSIAHKSILICQGNETNTYLAEALRSRGANVSIAILYQRALPAYRQIPDLRQIDIIQCTSSESMKNLVTLLGKEVLHKKLLLSSERLSDLAKLLGFSQQPLLAKNASDEAILQTLQQSLI